MAFTSSFSSGDGVYCGALKTKKSQSLPFPEVGSSGYKLLVHKVNIFVAVQSQTKVLFHRWFCYLIVFQIVLGVSGSFFSYPHLLFDYILLLTHY